jgi:hypothetical protein
MMRRYRNLLFLLLAFGSCNIASSNVDDSYASQTAYGGVGLIQHPSARFHKDGEFLFGVSTDLPYNRLFSKMQFLPWLEAVVRYSEGTYSPYNPGSPQTWKDKGLDIKLKLFDETNKFPAVAAGIIDLGGTGTFSSEYIVASKKFENFDISLGLGWGLYSGEAQIPNPFGILLDSYNTRGGRSGGKGGTLNLNKYFTGPKASIFGGIEYFTPIENLSLKIEFDSTNYWRPLGCNNPKDFEDPCNGAVARKIKLFEEDSEQFSIDSRINYALNYRLNIGQNDRVDLAIGLNRGNTIYANASIHTNLNFVPKQRFTIPKEELNKPYLKKYSQLNDEWRDYLPKLIMWQLGNEGFITDSLVFNGDEIQAVVRQGRFRKPINSIDLASRVLANNSPRNIKKISVINIDDGIQTYKSTINRDDLVAAVLDGPLTEEKVRFDEPDIFDDDYEIIKNDFLYPKFYWSIKPHALGTLQHQIKFYFYQIEALFNAKYQINRSLSFNTDIGIDLLNNYEDYRWHIPDGKLHHVRQDRRKYMTEGESGLRRMAFDYIKDISGNIKARLSLGYLEWMYGGVGGEVVYLSDDRNWGLGADGYWVKQRDFDQKFGFQDYETFTGFLSFYYDLPFYNLRLKTKYGRFLGQDKGVNIDLSRRFKNGARIGGIVSLTDCDPGCVGEGAFNKWIYFSLPMDAFYSNSQSRSRANYAWSPLTKDAGTQIENGNLYSLWTDSTDEIDSLRKKQFSFKKIFSGFSRSPRKKIS